MKAPRLTPPAWTADYIERVRRAAQALGSDGCSVVPDFYVDGCYEHDVHYRTHQTLDGRPITRRRADCWFRQRIQEMSWFGRFSPMSWWRWVAVRWAGESAWEADDEGSPVAARSEKLDEEAP